MTMPTLSAVLITQNEASKVEECLRSVAFADEKIVVDSMSSDATREMAGNLGAKVFVRPFDDFAAQKNFAIDKASGEWILLIDADERITPELAVEIRMAMTSPEGLDGYYLNRINFVFGGPMRFGSCRGDRQLRLMRRDKGRFEGKVHERIRLNGKAGRLKGAMIHQTSRTVDEYFKRFSQYTSLEARSLYERGRKPTAFHLWLRPVMDFVYQYFFRLGFLDGYRGFQYQVLSSFYIYVKYLKAVELFSNLAPK